MQKKQLAHPAHFHNKTKNTQGIRKINFPHQTQGLNESHTDNSNLSGDGYFPTEIRVQDECFLLLPRPFTTILEILARATRKEKEKKKDKQTGKENYLFTEGITIQVKKPLHWLQLTHKPKKTAEYKIKKKTMFFTLYFIKLFYTVAMII